jgi:hypothetical protein
MKAQALAIHGIYDKTSTITTTVFHHAKGS